MMDFARIKDFVNMERLLDSYGIPLRNSRCPCPLHGGTNPTSFSVHSNAAAWTCHSDCAASGDIFTFVERMENIGNAEARVFICERFGLIEPEAPKPQRKSAKRSVVKRTEYVYRDREGRPIYRVKRVDYDDGRKDCFQECNGKPTLPPSIRTLYNLDKIHGNTEDYICLCEGEKTADALVECGFIGTTNPLGSKNWEPEYAELLRGQKVVVMPDADEHGEKWRDEVMATLQGVAAQVQVVNIPESFIRNNPQYSGHDFADFLELSGKQEAIIFLTDSLHEAPVLPLGCNRELLGRPSDDFNDVVERAKTGAFSSVFNLNEWLPSLNVDIMPGDLIVLMANTGTGKTRLLHNIPFHIRRLNYAIFDLELSRETLAIRYGAMENRMSFGALKQRLESGVRVKRVDVDNVFVQKIPNLTPKKVAERVALLEKVTGLKIHVVAVDYIGLMSGRGSAYEKTSTNVEDFKAYISAAGKVGILTTQVSRPEHKEDGMFKCPSPYDAKNTGSIENSAQELIGFWRDRNDRNRLYARVLKYTHSSGYHKDVALDAMDLLISESSKEVIDYEYM